MSDFHSSNSGRADPISASTTIRLTIRQMWAVLGIVSAGAAAACAIYFGLTASLQAQRTDTNAELAKVNEQLAEIKWQLKQGLTREEFRTWIDDFRTINPSLRTPPLQQHPD